MPYYSYKCTSCKVEKIFLQKISDPTPDCERCIEASMGLLIPKMIRVFKPGGKPQFKGDGFYETDYKTKKKKPD